MSVIHNQKKYFDDLADGLYVWGEKSNASHPRLTRQNFSPSACNCKCCSHSCLLKFGFSATGGVIFLTRQTFFQMKSEKNLASGASCVASPQGAPLSSTASFSQLIAAFFDVADASYTIEKLGEVLTGWIDSIHRNSCHIDSVWVSNITYEVTRLMALISQLEKVQEGNHFFETAK